jgi:hypothetical protein
MKTATQTAAVSLNSLTDRELENCWLTLASLSDLGKPEANWVRRLIANIRAELNARQRAG